MDGSITQLAQPVKRPPLRLKGLALPNEHGSWSILLEPLISGIAVAPSPAAIFVFLLYSGAFLARQPLRVYLGGVKNRRRMPHGPVAFTLATAFLLLAAAGLVGTVFFGGAETLIPLVIATLLAAVQISFDVAGKSRKLIPELAGAFAMSSSACVAGLAAGWTAEASFALAGIFAMRLVPSMLYVRQRLLLEKGKPWSPILPTLSHIASLAGVTALAIYGLCPRLVLIAFALLAVRAALGLSPWRSRLRAMQIGILEIGFGVITMLAVILGYYFNI